MLRKLLLPLLLMVSTVSFADAAMPMFKPKPMTRIASPVKPVVKPKVAPKAMKQVSDFVWENKGSLGVLGLLTAMTAHPEAFTYLLGKIVTPVAEASGTVLRFILGAVLLAAGGYYVWCLIFKTIRRWRKE